MESPDPSKNAPRTEASKTDDPPVTASGSEMETIDLGRKPVPGAIAANRGSGSTIVDLDECARDLTESGLLDRSEVDAFREQIRSREGPQDAEALARELVKAGRLTRYQAGAVLQGKTKVLVIGNYVVLDRLGAGGMGIVYKARHRRLKRDVALKLLAPSVARDPSAVIRFQREAKAAAKLSHPNVVGVLDADEFKGLNFLVMEYAEGLDLSRRVREQGPLPVPLAIDCLVHAARGLKAIFEAGIVHRDIKPSNLMLEPSGNVKLLDMGLARVDEAGGLFGAEGADPALTQSNVLMGTVDYMSPEQAFNPRSADHRSDIYSLGCTLYFLLAGKAPFSAETLVGRIVAHREHPIPSLAEPRPDVPRRLENALKRLMAKSPDDRPASFDEVIALMESCRGDGPDLDLDEAKLASPVGNAQVDEPSPRRTLPRWLRPAAIGAGAFAAVVGLLATGVYLGRAESRYVEAKGAGPIQAPTAAPPTPPEAPKPPPPAPTVAAPATPVPPMVAGTEGHSGGEHPESPEPKPIPPSEPVGLVRELKGHTRRVNGVAVSRDGVRAMSGSSDRMIGLWDVATGSETRRMMSEAPVQAVALAADGGMGLSGHDDRSVHLWEFRSQHDVGARKLEGHTGPVFAVAFALDDRIALSGGADRTVRLWDVEAGRADGTPLAHPSPVTALAASRQSALAGCEDGTLWLWDLKSRQVVRRLLTPGPVLCVAVSPEGNRALTGHPDGLLVSWDLDHGSELGRMVGHGDLVQSAAYLPDARRALAGSQGGILILWDVEAGTILHRFNDPAGQLGIAVTASGDEAITADTDAILRLWRLPKPGTTPP